MSDTNYTLHGALPDYVIKEAGCDKLGFLKAEVHVHRPMPIDFSLMVLSAAPNVVGVPCVGVKWAGNNKGFYTFAYSYDGQVDPTNDSFAAATPIVCSLEGADSEEPIETHPQFLALVKKYGGTYNTDGTFSGFPATAPKGLAVDGDTKNPLYGVLDYLNIGYVWVRSYASPTILNSVYRNAGCIEDPQGSGPQQPPQLTGNRNWIKLAPRCQWRGNAWQIDERWRAGGRRGINQDVYQVAAR